MIAWTPSHLYSHRSSTVLSCSADNRCTSAFFVPLSPYNTTLLIHELRRSMRLPTPTFAVALTMEALVDKLRGALWGLYIGDALAMPVHWYYNLNQRKEDFGTITGYVAPRSTFPGSIMNLSNTGGGGRGSDKGSIVGDVIMHGKKQYWLKGSNYHYHHGLRAGEGTLEASLVRVLLKSMTANEGGFNGDDFLERYINFMTTPGTHNDVYCGTCHRMFFANWVKGKDPKHCADNDGHNVDTIDGMVPLIPIALSRLGEASNKADLKKDIKDCIWVNRASRSLETFGEVYVEMLHQAIAGEDLREICRKAGSRTGTNVDRMLLLTSQDPMTACYIDSSFPSLLYYAAKYGDDPEQALLRQTNAGGENVAREQALLQKTNAGGGNVARGALLGALLGASKGMNAFPHHLIDGLVEKDKIRQEINQFVEKALKRSGVRPTQDA